MALEELWTMTLKGVSGAIVSTSAVITAATLTWLSMCMRISPVLPRLPLGDQDRGLDLVHKRVIRGADQEGAQLA